MFLLNSSPVNTLPIRGACPAQRHRLFVDIAQPGVIAGCASMPAGATSRYALGAGGVGAARPTPAASLISVSRYALGARRTALRAEGAARLCAGRHSRWLPSPPRATRSAPMAWARCAPGRLRQPGRGLALRARRRWRGRRAPGRLHVPPPITRALPLSGGDVEDVVRFALLESSVQGARFALLPRARVGRGVSDTSIMHSIRHLDFAEMLLSSRPKALPRCYYLVGQRLIFAKVVY